MIKFLDRSFNATVPNDPQDIDADGSEENHTGAVPSLIWLGIITSFDAVNICTMRYGRLVLETGISSLSRARMYGDCTGKSQCASKSQDAA